MPGNSREMITSAELARRELRRGRLGDDALGNARAAE
jgi:hypothetical protein